MRLTAAGLSFLFFLIACDRAGQDAGPPPEPVEPAAVTESDVLPGLTAPASGVAFWTHPNVAFNSLMIVANKDGLVSYNIEDGNEVSRMPDINAKGVEVSYIGFGSLAAGVVATFDESADAFRFYGIDNSSRAFLPLEGGPAIRGNVRGFCLGRASTSANPSLFVVQKSAIAVYNLSLDDIGAEAPGLAVSEAATIETPDDIAHCAVDMDGVLLLATNDGTIYRLAGEDSFDAPFARSAAAEPAGLIVLPATAPEGAAQSVSGWIALLDAADGTVHLFDREDGNLAGAVAIVANEAAATDDEESAAPAPASVIGASGANLGGLYRNGAIALGAGGEEPAIRLMPLNGVQNALDLPASEPFDPRGETPAREDDDDLLIIPTDPTAD